mmetsp:Transcript_22257/g.71649  ORF Transcript_22257/g.71649 Transcript_22257/m.71649 type:complete len:229 (-) Transcript_22257:2394-3080(-)
MAWWSWMSYGTLGDILGSDMEGSAFFTVDCTVTAMRCSTAFTSSSIALQLRSMLSASSRVASSDIVSFLMRSMECARGSFWSSCCTCHRGGPSPDSRTRNAVSSWLASIAICTALSGSFTSSSFSSSSSEDSSQSSSPSPSSSSVFRPGLRIAAILVLAIALASPPSSRAAATSRDTGPPSSIGGRSGKSMYDAVNALFVSPSPRRPEPPQPHVYTRPARSMTTLWLE